MREDRWSVYREGDEAVIRLPIDDVTALQVSCATECPCRAPKAEDGVARRRWLNRALGGLIAPQPRRSRNG